MSERERTGGGALRFALAALALSCLTALAAGYLLQPAAAPERLAALAAAAPARPAAAANELVYRADRSGHYLVEASVNGAPVRFLVDTGATVVALTPEDARAAGLAPGDLRFSQVMSTANGAARAAPTRLRSLRLGQLELEDVPAVVMERPMAISLLGMSFLSRLDGYSIRDGVLTLEW